MWIWEVDWKNETKWRWTWSHSDSNITSAEMRKYASFFLIPSVVITIFGTATNLLSLSYFLTQRKSSHHRTATENLNKKLFILLNCCDVLVCATLSGELFILRHSGPVGFILFCHVIFMFVIFSTSFITCLLAVIRAASITWPHKKLQTEAVDLAIVIHSLGMGVLVLTNFEGSLIIQAILLISIFAVVVISNLVCIAKLLFSQVAPWKRSATVTMGILSVVYCSLNIGFLLGLCSLVFNKSGVNPVIEALCVIVLLPLNSACNPIVYFVRNKEMRKHLVKMWNGISGCCKKLRFRIGDIDGQNVAEGRNHNT